MPPVCEYFYIAHFRDCSLYSTFCIVIVTVVYISCFRLEKYIIPNPLFLSGLGAVMEKARKILRNYTIYICQSPNDVFMDLFEQLS